VGEDIGDAMLNGVQGSINVDGVVTGNWKNCELEHGLLLGTLEFWTGKKWVAILCRLG